MRLKKSGVLLSAVLFAATMVFAQSDNTKNTPKEQTKSTTTETPSATTKAKTISVVGKVKEFQANQSLEVTTPHNHYRKFDLSAKNTTVNGAENLKNGEMVKVTQTIQNGQKTINVQPYSSAHNSASHKK